MTKLPHEVSWSQQIPEPSLELIKQCRLPKTATIIDIGGGDSMLVDYLLDQGYENISVLDVSITALEKAKSRLGKKAGKINWIVSDITEFKPGSVFDLWHDRATLHFLTDENDLSKYSEVACHSAGRYMIIGTFSDQGPEKCSGLIVRKYSGDLLAELFHNDFKKIHCKKIDHITPSGNIQNFLFCLFQRKIST